MNKYDKKAKKFLEKTKMTLNIKKSKSKSKNKPFWISKENPNCGIKYEVTLKRGQRTYTFDFWDSVYNKEREEKLSKYSVLSSLEIHEEESFEDFCRNFGYNNDSIKAKNTHESVKLQSLNIQRLLSDEEIKKLREIN